MFITSLLLFSISSIAQDDADWYVYGTIKDNFTRKKMGGVTVSVKQDGKVFDSQQSTSSGKYEFFLPLGHTYELTFSKSGIVSKKLEVATQGIPEEDRRGGFSSNLDMSLFEEIEGVDFSLLEEPIGKAAYQADRGSIEFDMNYTARMQAEIAKLMKQVEDIQKDEEKAEDKAAAEAAKLEEQFQKLMESGKGNMTSKSYGKAVNDFEAAVGLKPDDAKAKSSLADAKKALEEQEAAAAADKNYNDAIDKGDAAMSAREWAEAITNYEKALSIKSGEKYPKEQVDKANAALEEEKANAAKEAEVANLIKEGDDQVSQKEFDKGISKYEAALKVIPGNKEAQDKLAEAKGLLADYEAEKEQRERYDALIADADGLFSGKDYAQSITKYEAALEVMPKEAHPEQRIKEARDLIAALEAEEAAAAEMAAKQAEYDALMKSGRSSRDGDKYDEAIADFEKASKVLTENATALAAIDEAKKAKQEAEQEAEMAVKQAEYDALMATAQASLDASQYDDAIRDFEKAIGILTDNSSAEKGLADAKSAKADAEAEAAEAERYQRLIEEADAAFGKEDYEEAIDTYTQAIEVKDDAYPKGKIEEARAILEAAKAQAEADRLAAEEAAAAAELQAKYQEYMDDGQSAVSDEDYETAISKFEGALAVIAGDSEATSALAAAQKALEAQKANMAQAELQERFDQMIADGDDAMSRAEFESAIEKYQGALSVIAGEPTATEKLSAAKKAIADRDAAMAEADRLAAEAARAAADEEARLAAEADEAARLAAEEEARMAAEADAAEMQARYDKYMADGRGASKKEDFQSAIDNFEGALGIKPGDSNAQSELQKAKDDLAAKNLADEEAARKRAEEEGEAQKQSRYNDLISEGDGLFKSEDYEPAAESYRSALEVFPGDKKAQSKLTKAIEELEKQQALLAEEERRRQEEDARQAELDAQRAAEEAARRAEQDAATAEQEYRALLARADEDFSDDAYDEARELYQEARDRRREDPYPKSQIEKIDQILSDRAEKARLRAERLAASRIEQEDKSFERGDDLDSSAESEIDRRMADERRRRLQEKWDAMAREKQDWTDKQAQLKEKSSDRREETEVQMRSYSDYRSDLSARAADDLADRSRNMEGYKEGLASQDASMVEEQRDRMEDNRQAAIELNEELAKASQRYQSEDAQSARVEAVASYESSRADIAEKGRKHMEKLREATAKEKQEAEELYTEYSQRGRSRVEDQAQQISEQKQQISEDQSDTSRENLIRTSEELEKDKERNQQFLTDLSQRADEERGIIRDNLMTQETYAGGKSPIDYTKSDLAAKYPAGVTEETFSEGSSEVIRRIVVVGNKATEYRKVVARSGTYYFKNGSSITEHLWKIESDKVLE